MGNNKNPYDDIINMSRPISRNHKPMPLYDRAAQFAPFAALTGHDAAIKETARLTGRMIEQSEDMLTRLDEKLQLLSGYPGTEVTITYFVPDERKSGGVYESYTGIVRRIDNYERRLIMTDNKEILIDRIIKMESFLFDEMGIYE